MSLALVKIASPCGAPKARLVNQDAQVVLIRQAQGLVVLVEPVHRHRQRQRAPGVEAGGARIGVRHSFGLDGRAVKSGPLRLQEGEVAHGVRLEGDSRW